MAAPRAAWSPGGYAGAMFLALALVAISGCSSAPAPHRPPGLFPRDLGYDPAAGYVLVPDYLSENVEFLRAPPAP